MVRGACTAQLTLPIPLGCYFMRWSCLGIMSTQLELYGNSELRIADKNYEKLNSEYSIKTEILEYVSPISTPNWEKFICSC